MSSPGAAPPPPDDWKRVQSLRYRSREHAYRSQAALDGGVLDVFQDQRHVSRLERDLADEIEARIQP